MFLRNLVQYSGKNGDPPFVLIMAGNNERILTLSVIPQDKDLKKGYITLGNVLVELIIHEKKTSTVI